MSYLSWGYLVLNKAKLDNSFPSAQFSTPDYEIRVRRDRRKNEGRLIEFVKKGLIYKRLNTSTPAEAKALALKLLYIGENGYALVSIGLLLMKLWKYVLKS